MNYGLKLETVYEVVEDNGNISTYCGSCLSDIMRYSRTQPVRPAKHFGCEECEKPGPCGSESDCVFCHSPGCECIYCIMFDIDGEAHFEMRR